MKRRRRSSGHRTLRRRWLTLLLVTVIAVSGAYWVLGRSGRGVQPTSATSGIMSSTAMVSLREGPYFWALIPQEEGYNAIMNLTRMYVGRGRLSSFEKTVYTILASPHLLVVGSDNRTIYSAFLVDLRSLEFLRLYLKTLGASVHAVRANSANVSLESLSSALVSSNMDSSWLVVRPEGLETGSLVAAARSTGIKCMARGREILVAPRDLESLVEVARSMGGDIVGVYDQYPALIYRPT